MLTNESNVQRVNFVELRNDMVLELMLLAKSCTEFISDT